MDTTIRFPALLGPETSGMPCQAEPSTQLIEAAAAGNEEAFRKLVEVYQDAIYHFCFQWLRQEEDAREACQDTFVRAYQNLSRYKDQGKFRTWLYKIALNRCRDFHKSKSAREQRQVQSLEGQTGHLAFGGHSPDEAVAQAEDLRKLQEGIQQLPEKLRIVAILCGVEGLSQEDCAKILECSVRAVEGRYYRARRALAEWWEQESQSS